jgi:Raf kinase inhibitor-like YbhB/YbcL family protein
VESFSRIGYHGPCPPPGGPHRYVFKLYALDTELKLPPRKTVTEIERAMQDHVLAEAKLTGLYQR